MVFSVNIAKAQAVDSIRFKDKALLENRIITLQDVADLSSLPAMLRQPAKTLELGHVAAHSTPISMPTQKLASRARALMPALTPWLPDNHIQHIALRFVSAKTSVVPTQPSRHCWRMVQDVAAQAALTRPDVQTTPCTSDAQNLPLQYRAADQSLSAAEDLAAGSIVSLSFQPILPDIRRGENIVIGMTIGPVQVQRSAQALQSGRAGEHMFVQTQDNKIVAVAVPGARP